MSVIFFNVQRWFPTEKKIDANALEYLIQKEQLQIMFRVYRHTVYVLARDNADMNKVSAIIETLKEM